jgi:hypothetical protein
MDTISHYKNIAVEYAVFLLRTWDLLGSNTDPDTGHQYFSSILPFGFSDITSNLAIISSENILSNSLFADHHITQYYTLTTQ